MSEAWLTYVIRDGLFSGHDATLPQKSLLDVGLFQPISDTPNIVTILEAQFNANRAARLDERVVTKSKLVVVVPEKE